MSCKGKIGVETADTGPGPVGERRERLFQSIVSTKAIGIDLGLAVCSTIDNSIIADVTYQGGGALPQCAISIARVSPVSG